MDRGRRPGACAVEKFSGNFPYIEEEYAPILETNLHINRFLEYFWRPVPTSAFRKRSAAQAPRIPLARIRAGSHSRKGGRYAALGAVYGPYTGRCFADRRKTDIEHIVALSEAHDSGLCAADTGTRWRFASDLLNLTLAGPDVNRNRKKHHDAAQWMPPMNRCWFAARVVEVRRKYALTVDAREANALESVLSACASTEMVVRSCEADRSAATPKAPRSVPSSGTTDALRRWDDNGNGRITCREARRHGIAPVPRGHPAYPFMHDGDGDGVVCE